MIILSDESIDGQQLHEWTTTQLKCPINVPSFSSLQVIKLPVSCKHKMATITNLDISPKEVRRDMVVIEDKFKVHTGSLGLVLCRKRFAARARNSGFGKVGHGPLPICSSRTYKI